MYWIIVTLAEAIVPVWSIPWHLKAANAVSSLLYWPADWSSWVLHLELPADDADFDGLDDSDPEMELDASDHEPDTLYTHMDTVGMRMEHNSVVLCMNL